MWSCRGMSIAGRTWTAPNAVHRTRAALDVSDACRAEGCAAAIAVDRAATPAPSAAVVSRRPRRRSFHGRRRRLFCTGPAGAATQRCRDAVELIHRCGCRWPGGPGHGSTAAAAPASSAACGRPRRSQSVPPGGCAAPTPVHGGLQPGSAWDDGSAAAGCDDTPGGSGVGAKLQQRPRVSTGHEHVDTWRPAERNHHHEHDQRARGSVNA